jgi:type 1 fimbria pilin
VSVGLTLVDTSNGGLGSYDTATGSWVNTATTSKATNVNVQLFDRTSGTDTLLRVKVPMRKTTDVNGSASWTIAGKFYTTGVGTVGNVFSTAGFLIDYQ